MAKTATNRFGCVLRAKAIDGTQTYATAQRHSEQEEQYQYVNTATHVIIPPYPRHPIASSTPQTVNNSSARHSQNFTSDLVRVKKYLLSWHLRHGDCHVCDPSRVEVLQSKRSKQAAEKVVGQLLCRGVEQRQQCAVILSELRLANATGERTVVNLLQCQFLYSLYFKVQDRYSDLWRG